MRIDFLILAGFIFIALSCATHKPASFEKPKEAAPNCVYVSDDLMCDVSEMSNSGYSLYIKWIEEIYGTGSKEYKQVLPDTTVWRYYTGDAKKLTDTYFFDEYYEDFPMVGISSAQAKAYASWRTDRVLEVKLLRKGLITQKIIDGKLVDFFTIEKYFSGKYFDYKPDPSIRFYQKFSLPTQADRDTIIQFFNQKEKDRNHIIGVETQTEMDLLYTCPLNSVKSSKEDRKGENIYHLLGNVAEWGDEYGVAFGGSWLDSLHHIIETDVRRDGGRNSWTGFRNVCRWVPVEN